ncbi:MAG: hypothetical protein ACO3JL_15530, partial [Myxococcota bacterium]
MSQPRVRFLRALAPFLAIVPIILGGCPLGGARCRSDVDCPSGEVCRAQACQAIAAAPVDDDEATGTEPATEAPAEDVTEESPAEDSELDGGVGDAG